MFPEDEKKDGIEELREELYSRNRPENPREERDVQFKKNVDGIRTDWKAWETEKKETPDETLVKKPMPLLKKLFVAAIIFFVFSAGLSAYVFFGGGNVVSTKNVGIKVNAPVAVSAGDEFPMEITINNQNNTALEEASILVEFPTGTRKFENIQSEFLRHRKTLGEIPAGQATTTKVSAVLYGQQGDKKNINISIEYRVANSNAILAKSIVYEAIISSSPVTLSVTSLSEVSAGQEIEIGLEVSSNSASIIKNLLLKGEYPYGFTFKNAAPVPTYDANTWDLGDFRAGSKTSLKIRGKIDGQEGDQKTFKFSIGSQDPDNEKSISVTYVNAAQTVSIQKPFVAVDLSLNGDSGNPYIGRAGKNIKADLNWTNNLSSAVTDVKVEAKLSGSIFDQGSISAGTGFWRSLDNTVIWDQTTEPAFISINPDQNGKIGFTFNTRPMASDSGVIKNPQMTIDVTVSGRQVSDLSGQHSVIGTYSRTIKLSSDLGLVSKIIYSSGPFSNTGPVPPRADMETTYTVVWTLTNTSNNLSNVKVYANLPNYVKWLGNVSPSAENVVYNQTDGSVNWNVGDLKAGTGYDNTGREVAFQISFTPSQSQIGATPNLVNETTGSGTDKFTGTGIMSNVRSALTTSLVNDSGYSSGSGVVGR
ncbi:MAG: hypothetical protein WCT19_00145 [Candidatus Paceibacterota bacterium]